MDYNQKEFLEGILATHSYKAINLIAIMQDVQKEYRYLPEDMLCYIADRLKISHARVYAVATFYENFSLDAKGKYLIRCCDGTACHVRKSTQVINALKEALNLKSDEKTTPDMLFTVETVSCLGACGLAPVITINDVVYPAMTPEKIKQVIAKIKEEEGVK